MNCHEAQESFSLYLYGELDFAAEEQLEAHLGECAFCQRRLAREKQWHTAANSVYEDVPLSLLTECRQQLGNKQKTSFNWRGLFDISFDRWAPRWALASALVFVGFAGGRWFNPAPTQSSPMTRAGLVREIAPAGNGNVKITVEQESEILGRVDDPSIKKLLVDATQQSDPEVRYSSLEVLNAHGGSDVRGVFSNCARYDPNPSVRLKAIEGLRRFPTDPETLDALKFALEHDMNPGVRSVAIEVLVPSDGNLDLNPATVQILQEVVRSQQNDDYVRLRCVEVLHQAKFPVIY